MTPTPSKTEALGALNKLTLGRDLSILEIAFAGETLRAFIGREGEAVAWRYKPKSSKEGWAFSLDEPVFNKPDHWTVEPVYTHPAPDQLVPWSLSEEQFDNVMSMIKAAYEAGATDVDNNYDPDDRDPDFSEAANDYAATVGDHLLSLFPDTHPANPSPDKTGDSNEA